MSDEEDFFESEEESGEDFSASEDEWKPSKDDRVSEAESESEESVESADSDLDGDDDDDDEDSNKRKKKGP